MVLLIALLVALAGGGISFGSAYDCGPHYARFTVLSCSQGMCRVSYTNPGRATYRTSISESAVRTAIGRGCRPRTVQSYRSEAAQAEARAASLLAGTSHAAGNVPPKRSASHAGGGAIVLGKYECYMYSGGRLEAALALNFTLHPGGRFTDFEGHPGRYTVSGNMLTFSGTGLNGQHLRYQAGIPHSQHPPSLTFIRNGEFRESCDGQG